MDQLTKALTLAKRGWHVFPCGPNKRPLTAHGVYDGTTNAEEIATWWSLDYPAALIGVWAGKSGLAVLDVDDKNGKDGAASLRSAGLTPSPTLSFRSQTGAGVHHWYTTGDDIGQALDYRGMVGVDRKAGNSYAIFYGDDPKAAIAQAPDWLLEQRLQATSGATFEGSVREWLEYCPSGEPDATVLRFIDSIPATHIGHDAALKFIKTAVLYAPEGHTGVPTALTTLRERFIEFSTDDDPARDFANALDGAILKYGGFVAPATVTDAPASDAEHAAAVAAEVKRLRIQRDAKRQVAAEEYANAEEIELLTVEDLEAMPDTTPLIEGFIDQDNTILLAGPPGMGKSFLVLDAALRIATGTPLFGEMRTTRGKVLYVAGEGATGIPKRLRAWEAHTGLRVPSESFRLARNGVNLSDAASVMKVRDLVREHGFTFIVIDTFRKLTRVETENDTTGVTEVALNADMIRNENPGCSILVVHHTNKQGLVNGTEAFRSDFDTIWLGRGDSGMFRLSSRTEDGGKMKNDAGSLIEGMRLESVGQSAVVVKAPGTLVHEPDLTDSLDMDATYTTSELADWLLEREGASRSTAERAIRNLVDSGKLAKVSQGKYRRQLPSIGVAA